MAGGKASSIASKDAWLEHPDGKIYARVWSPSIETTQLQRKAPIVLFHDSLGCVDCGVTSLPN